jgi:hypothetical protein
MTTQSKTDIAILPLRECFEAIIANKDAKALNYCVNYAQRGIEMIDRGDELWTTPNNLRVQILYVLNNMTHWRGDLAKQVRASLKHHEKELRK